MAREDARPSREDARHSQTTVTAGRIGRRHSPRASRRPVATRCPPPRTPPRAAPFEGKSPRRCPRPRRGRRRGRRRSPSRRSPPPPSSLLLLPLLLLLLLLPLLLLPLLLLLPAAGAQPRQSRRRLGHPDAHQRRSPQLFRGEEERRVRVVVAIPGLVGLVGLDGQSDTARVGDFSYEIGGEPRPRPPSLRAVRRDVKLRAERLGDRSAVLHRVRGFGVPVGEHEHREPTPRLGDLLQAREVRVLRRDERAERHAPVPHRTIQPPRQHLLHRDVPRGVERFERASNRVHDVPETLAAFLAHRRDEREHDARRRDRTRRFSRRPQPPTTPPR